MREQFGAQQQELIAALEAKIAALEAKVGPTP